MTEPEMRSPAALPSDRAKSQYLNQPQQNTQADLDKQEQILRRRFAVGFALATSLAPLVWGLPR